MHLDHHSPEFAERRHELFAELRRDAPVVFSDVYGGFYIVTSYATGRRVLRDDEHFAVSRFEDGSGGLLIPAVMKAPALRPGELDGAEHLAYRKALHESFKPTTVEGLEGFVQRIIDETFDDVIPRGDFDVMADLAAVIPARVIMEYLGLPSDEHERFLEGLALGFRADPDPQEAADQHEQFEDCWQAMLATVAEKRMHPTDDVISRLAEHEIGFSDDELLSVILNICLGGTATTMAWLGYATMALEQDRSLRDRLQREPELIPAFGEELLRFFSPASSLARNVIKDVELDGTALTVGDRVYVAIPSLNRDEATFANGETFDVDRERKQHMGFGVGAHFCLGVHLARLEFRLYVTSLLRRLPEYRVDAPRSVHTLSVGVIPRWLTMPAKASV